MRPLVRILIVTDDGPANGGFLQWSSQPMPEAVGTNSREFHLGEFVRVLQDSQWVGFNVEITRAHRTAPGGGLSEAALKAERGADVVGFRFNQPFNVNGESRTLANYDMILFFPISTGNADLALTPEADAIAHFMEGGGGFFATGDHANLGGQLAALIPRVRSMRRWYFNGSLSAESPPGPAGEPAAPPPLGYYRHDTTRKGQDNIGQFEDQSDEIPQVIAPANYGAGLTVKQGYVTQKYLPHPLLCSPDGVVNYLPDHMHEGSCEVPDNLAGRTFTLGGATLREYPDYLPPNPPPGYAAGPLSPEIVATGFVLPNTTSPALDPDAHTGAPDAAQVASFGVIGAWDGHRVSKGRVVVDSTWHHFFNINLTGDRYLEDDNLGAAHEQKLHGFYVPDGMGGRVANDEYKMIQWYYRNIVYWLIPANRSQTIWWNVLHDISRRAQLREELGAITQAHEIKNFRFEHYLYFGQLAQTYLAQARGGCANYLIHQILYKPKIPWWEWIQEFVDVWDPAQKLRDKSRIDEIARERLLGAWGAGPQPETGIALSLGAAIITAAFTSRQFHDGGDASKAAEAAQKLFPSVLNHALKEFGTQLNRGMEVQRKLENVIAGQLAANRSDTQ